MRYHAVVFHTILNGNNYIVDYTKGNLGKIGSFLNDADPGGFYSTRSVCLDDVGKTPVNWPAPNRERFLFESKLAEDAYTLYTNAIKTLFGM